MPEPILSGNQKKGTSPQIPAVCVAKVFHAGQSPKISFAVSPDPSDPCDDRSPVKENMMNTATESEKNASAPEVPQPK
jgi:hypothetical protein